jgi:hypothetical protein
MTGAGGRRSGSRASTSGRRFRESIPSEFPADDGTYEKWLKLAAEMGSNTIRVYTIHPPYFYRAGGSVEPGAPARATLADSRRVGRAPSR